MFSTEPGIIKRAVVAAVVAAFLVPTATCTPVDRGKGPQATESSQENKSHQNETAQNQEPEHQNPETQKPAEQSPEAQKPSDQGPSDQKASSALVPIDLLKDPMATKVLTYMVNPKTIASNGASGTNMAYESGRNAMATRFDVADQRHCWQAVARGLAENDTSYIEQGLKAIDYAFAHQEEHGNFGKSRWFETMGFLEAASRCYMLIGQSKYSSTYLPRLKAYVPKMKSAIGWMIETKDKEFKADWEQAPDHINVVAGTAVTFQLVGKITGDGALIRQGKDYANLAMSRQWTNGVFPESSGYDSSYQAVTLFHLMIYLMYSDDQELNGRLRKALEKGWEWEKSRITSDGEVTTEGNARTGPKGEVWRGKVKVINYPEVIMSLVYWSHVGKDQKAKDLAGKVFEYGLYLYEQQKRQH